MPQRPRPPNQGIPSTSMGSTCVFSMLSSGCSSFNLLCKIAQASVHAVTAPDKPVKRPNGLSDWP